MQVKQALIGLGSGGWFGVGFGHSNQRNLFLPEAWGDFIFAILGEETGLVGAAVVLAVYLLMFFIGIIVAKNTKDLFGQLLASAISISFVLYAFIHAGVVTGLLPTTGLTLPLISHGGTSIIMTCMSLGILINIGITNSKYELYEEGEVVA
jgi:cell division protein FtsW